MFLLALTVLYWFRVNLILVPYGNRAVSVWNIKIISLRKCSWLVPGNLYFCNYNQAAFIILSKIPRVMAKFVLATHIIARYHQELPVNLLYIIRICLFKSSLGQFITTKVYLRILKYFFFFFSLFLLPHFRNVSNVGWYLLIKM